MKERLVGAVVLVALGVWLIPWVLDGSNESVEPEETALTLPVPADDEQLRSQTIVLDNDREMPTPVADAPAETDSAPSVDSPVPEEPVQTVSEPSAEPPVAEPPVAEPPAAAVASSSPPEPESGWYVQAGAYEDAENARRQADRVSALGFDAKVSEFPSGDTTIQRVRIGPQQSRDNAEAIASALSAHGFVVRVLSEE